MEHSIIANCATTYKSGYHKLVIFDMDDTLLKGRFLDCYAKQYGHTEKLAEIRKNSTTNALRTQAIGALFRGQEKESLIAIADGIKIVPDAKYIIHRLQQKGFLTGILTDSYTIVANCIAQKLGINFVMANELKFEGGIATGKVTIPSYFYPNKYSVCTHHICKTHAITQLQQDHTFTMADCMAIGDSENDECMIKHAGYGVAFNTKYEPLKHAARLSIEEDSFFALLNNPIN